MTQRIVTSKVDAVSGMEPPFDSSLTWGGQLAMTIGRTAQCVLPVTKTPTSIGNCSTACKFTPRIITMATVEMSRNPQATTELAMNESSWLDWIPVGNILLILGTILAVFAVSLGIVHRILRKKGAVPYQIPHFCVWASRLFPFVRYKNTSVHMTFLPSLKAAEKMEVKEDDVFVASFPRSGTTWTQEIVYLVANNANVEKARAKFLSDRFPYLEAPFMGQYKVSRLASPRLIKTHLPYHLLPRGIHQKNAKIIYVMRNFKDVIVSNYNFFKCLSLPYGGTFDDFCQLFFENKYVFSPWWRHVKEFWENRHRSNILILKYEEMQQDLEGTVKKLSQFLGKPLSDDQIQTIVGHCSFDSMKKNVKVNHKWWDDIRFTQNNDFIRKGKVGDWKNYFNKDLSKQADELVKNKLGDTGLSFCDEL